MENNIKLALILGLAFIFGVLGNGYINYQLKMKQEDIKAGEENVRLARLASCIDNANLNGLATWDSNCARSGIKNPQGGRCLLPTLLADSIEKHTENEKQNCIKMFGK